MGTALTFWTISANGQMTPVPAESVFPAEIRSECRYDLPREGQTIRVTSPENKVISEVTWNGTVFVRGS